MRSRQTQPMQPNQDGAAQYWQEADKVLIQRASNARSSVTFEKGTSLEEIRDTLKARQADFHKEHTE